MTEDQIKHMTDRFLGWKLPETFSPDGGIITIWKTMHAVMMAEKGTGE